MFLILFPYSRYMTVIPYRLATNMDESDQGTENLRLLLYCPLHIRLLSTYFLRDYQPKDIINISFFGW